MDDAGAEALSNWVAPPEMRTHSGSPLTGDEVFFVRPDPALGEVRSAYTTLRAGQVHYSRATQILTFWLTLVGSVAVVQAVLFGTQLPMFGYWVLSVGVPIALVMWAGSVVRFDREVSYVGSLGVARFGYRGSRDRFAVAEVFLFEDAGFLLVECQKEAHAIKWCTAWTFSWMRWEDEEVVHARSGRFFSRSELPKETDDSYHFVRATEVAWSEYLRRSLPQSCVSMPK